MEINYDLFSLKAALPTGTAHAVTIGNFDGVHAGHRQLITAARAGAARHGIPVCVVTFEPHPQRVLSASRAPDLLTSLPRKLELLADLGVDRTLVLPFTPAMATLSTEEFVRSVLVDGLAVRELLVGHDFALGKGRSGHAAQLTELGALWGFGVEQLPAVYVDDELVSSSLIRHYIRDGLVDMVRPLLGGYHSVEGTVAHGEHRGRDLGFPTANIGIGEVLLPQPGVYATWAEIAPAGAYGRQPLPSVTNIGTNPTFGGASISVEAHLLDFSHDLYGCSLRLFFVKRLRAEQRFTQTTDLITQISCDVLDARATLENALPPNIPSQ